MNPPLGTIKTVDVKKVWAHEQYEFTTWLAKEENIARLAAAVGLELAVEGVEVAVGPYSADILAKDVGNDHYVIIENQFGKTNHDHLGKLITYASFLDASAIIWVAEHFTEEHQRALDWMNDHTTDDLSFYGVALELWQIDDSNPAVRFNVVTRPPVTKPVQPPVGLTEAKKVQLDFWTKFRDRLVEKHVVASAQTPRPQYWFDVALGKAGIYLSNIANTSDGRIGVRVYIGHRYGESALATLEAEREAIEAELGTKLTWNPNPENRDKVIALYRDVDFGNQEKWPEHVEWLVDQVARFRKVFGPRVKLIKASEPENMVSQLVGLPSD